jgi:hypothetical protein
VAAPTLMTATPAPGLREVLVEVKEAGIDPGEVVRQSVLPEMFLATFCSSSCNDGTEAGTAPAR